MDTAIDFLKKEIKPKLHNKSLYDEVKKLLQSNIYAVSPSWLAKNRDRILTGEFVNPPIITKYHKDGYKNIQITPTINIIQSSWGKEHPFQHDWIVGGNLQHAKYVYKTAISIWQTFLKTILKKSDTNLSAKFIEDTEDAIRIGSFLHDIGKICVYQDWDDFQRTKDNYAYIHELYGQYILGLMNISNPYVQRSIELCGVGHQGYVLLEDGRCVMKTKQYSLKEYHYTAPIAPYIVCLADKIGSGYSRLDYVEATGEGLRVKETKESLSKLLAYVDSFEDCFNIEKHTKGDIFRQRGYENQGFGLYLYDFTDSERQGRCLEDRRKSSK